MEYQKRRKLIEDALLEEDYEPAIADIQYEGETAKEFYRKNWINEFMDNLE